MRPSWGNRVPRAEHPRYHTALDDSFVLGHVSRYESRSTRQIMDSIALDYGSVSERTVLRRLRSLRKSRRVVWAKSETSGQYFYRRFGK